MNKSVLAIDTSGPVTFASLRDSSGRFFSESQRRKEVSDPNSESVAELVASLTGKAQVKPSDLSAIFVGTGPGSFTGLRIGLSFLKGLSFALKIPLVGIGSLAAFAWEHLSDSNVVVAVANAQRSELFFGVYKKTGGKLIELVPVKIIVGSEIEGETKRIVESVGTKFERVVFCGFPEIELPGVSVFESTKVGESLVALGHLEGDNFCFDPVKMADLEPNYLRKVNARTIEERSKKAD